MMTIPELAARYGTRITADNITGSAGLTADEAAQKLKEHGPNALTPPKETPGACCACTGSAVARHLQHPAL